MKKLNYSLLVISLLISLVSCQSKTKNFLIKKWDCVQVENISLIDKNFATAQDTAVAMQTEAALKALSWTFNSNNTYQCSVGNRVTVDGTYELTDDEKTITCTSSSKNSINSYTITSISEFQLILTSTGTAVPVILHFSPN